MNDLDNNPTSVPETNGINNVVNATAPVTPVQPVEPQPLAPVQAPVQVVQPQTMQVNPQPVQVNTPQAQNAQVNKAEAVENGIHRNEIKNDLLLLSFIGKNCEKITTRSFNFAGFFFGTLYMLYRKMFAYSLLFNLLSVLIINVTQRPYLLIIVNLIIGFSVNKLYVKHAVKKILKINVVNSGKEMNELQLLCAKKGGTSFIKMMLGVILQAIISAIIVGAIVVLLFIFARDKFFKYVNLTGFNSYFNYGSTTNNGNNTNQESTTKIEGDKIVYQDVKYGGSMCVGSVCTIILNNGEMSGSYTLKTDKSDILLNMDDYKDYIKVDVYVTKSDKDQYITDAKIYNRKDNSDLSSHKTISTLRVALGFYDVGTHTDIFTLKEIGTQGYGISDSESYTYIPLTLVNDKGLKIEMDYINPDESVSLVKNKKYEVKFKVKYGIFDYEYKIDSIRQK